MLHHTLASVTVCKGVDTNLLGNRKFDRSPRPNPQAMNNEICTVDFVMRNTHTIFHHNPLEVYISQESAITSEKKQNNNYNSYNCKQKLTSIKMYRRCRELYHRTKTENIKRWHSGTH